MFRLENLASYAYVYVHMYKSIYAKK